MGRTRRLGVLLAVVAGTVIATSGRASAFSTGELSVGGRHACAFFSAGHLGGGNSILCWGANDFGQASPPAGTFFDLAAGRNHTCAMRPDTTVVCWGDGSHGETAAPSGLFQHIASGDGFSCGVRGDLTLACWGKNDVGQSSPPSGIYSGVTAGYAMACATRFDDSQLVCWGATTVGPVPLPPAAVAVDTACAIGTGHFVSCFGDTANGQASPPSVPIATIAGGDGFFCGTTIGPSPPSTMTCWGADNPGAHPPALSLGILGLGDAYGCGVQAGNPTIFCWGSNQDGQTTPPVACPAGQSGPLGFPPCSLCPAGQFSAGTGNTACTLCDRGKYNPVPGATQCSLSCQPGTFSSAGAASCTPCPAGSYIQSAGAGFCNTCANGQIAPSPGSATCTFCPPGLLSDSTHTQCVAPPVPAIPPWAAGLFALLIVGSALVIGRRRA
jgi:hypothetical protein